MYHRIFICVSILDLQNRTMIPLKNVLTRFSRDFYVRLIFIPPRHRIGSTQRDVSMRSIARSRVRADRNFPIVDYKTRTILSRGILFVV